MTPLRALPYDARQRLMNADVRFLGAISLALGRRQAALLMVLPFLSLYAQERGGPGSAQGAG